MFVLTMKNIFIARYICILLIPDCRDCFNVDFVISSSTVEAIDNNNKDDDDDDDDDCCCYSY